MEKSQEEVVYFEIVGPPLAWIRKDVSYTYDVSDILIDSEVEPDGKDIDTALVG